MADEKKPASSGTFDFIPNDPLKLLLFIFSFFLLMFVIWWLTGGPERYEATGPYVAPPVGTNKKPDDPNVAKNPKPTDWKKATIKDFTLFIPYEWQLVITKEEQLVYRGEFRYNNMPKLFFEHGLYTLPGVDMSDTRYSVKKEQIGPEMATIYTPKKPGLKTIVYFDRYPYKESLALSGIGLTTKEQAELLAIVRTVRFSTK